MTIVAAGLPVRVEKFRHILMLLSLRSVAAIDRPDYEEDPLDETYFKAARGHDGQGLRLGVRRIHLKS